MMLRLQDEENGKWCYDYEMRKMANDVLTEEIYRYQVKK